MGIEERRTVFRQMSDYETVRLLRQTYSTLQDIINEKVSLIIGTGTLSTTPVSYIL